MRKGIGSGLLMMIALGLCVHSQDLNELKQEWNKADQAYRQAMDRSIATLERLTQKALDDAKSNNNEELSRKLTVELKEFREQGRLPQTESLQPAVETYRKELEQHSQQLKESMFQASNNKKLPKNWVTSRTKFYKQYLKDYDQYLTQAKVTASEIPTAGERPLAPKTPFLDYTFFEWKNGDGPLKLISKDEGFCYFLEIRGSLAKGESLDLRIREDDCWHLDAKILDQKPVAVRIAAVRVGGKPTPKGE